MAIKKHHDKLREKLQKEKALYFSTFNSTFPLCFEKGTGASPIISFCTGP